MLSVTYYAQNYAGIIGWSLMQTMPWLDSLCYSTNMHLVFGLSLLPYSAKWWWGKTWVNLAK